MTKIKGQIFQVKIQLESIRPPIWRRILVHSGTTLSKLHDIIQVTMGWMDTHLHMFEKDQELFGPPDPDGFMNMNSERTQLATLLRYEKDSMRYEYDFGDGWSHKITLEKIIPADPLVALPMCVKGVRSCPPEDCGGPWGYMHLLEVLADPNHDEYEEMLEWVGEYFAPEAFDVAQTNELLVEYCS